MTGWYHTRDMGAIEAGELFVIGRVDHMLNINGKNLFAHELEDQINKVTGVAPGRVLASAPYDAATGSSVLNIWVEPSQDDLDFNRLEGEIRKVVFSACSIPASEVRVLPRGTLIKTSSGKIARVASQEKSAFATAVLTNQVRRFGCRSIREI